VESETAIKASFIHQDFHVFVVNLVLRGIKVGILDVLVA
jgi:hypothetical protein